MQVSKHRRSDAGKVCRSDPNNVIDAPASGLRVRLVQPIKTHCREHVALRPAHVALPSWDDHRDAVVPSFDRRWIARRKRDYGAEFPGVPFPTRDDHNGPVLDHLGSDKASAVVADEDIPGPRKIEP